MERVLAIHDWYDGPRTGVTEFAGEPYWYRSIYLDTPEWDPDEDRFELTPLTSEMLTRAIELKAIFERWHLARKAGAVSETEARDPNAFGALPAERERRTILDRELSAYLNTRKFALLARGTFELGCERVHWQALSDDA